ncbi:MAG: Ig-like domain-containing protein, partial [Oscillospiraceae bacterium]
ATDISLDLSKAEGVDHLLVQVADYADNTATYKINLNKEELSGPVSVTLDKQSIKMYKGGTAALNAEVSPFGVKPDGVTWKSSDETVATVNERGIITGVNKGTATITAASIKDPTATASCVVTVQTVDTTLVGALMDTNGDAQFYTWDMEHDTTWKKLVAFESLKSRFRHYLRLSQRRSLRGGRRRTSTCTSWTWIPVRPWLPIPASRAKSPCGIWSTA